MAFLRNLKSVTISTLPLLAVVLFVCIFIKPTDAEGALKLTVGFIAVVIGQTFFLIGLDGSVLPIGKLVGGSLVKLKKIVFVILFGFLFGLLATVAEPALEVLARQLDFIMLDDIVNATFFVWLLGVGIGIAVALALFRIIKNINIKITFLVRLFLNLRIQF